MEATDTINTESTSEHKVKIYPQRYHGVEIKIIEFDHMESSQAETKYKMPENWREQLTEQINSTTGPIAPEYCMPDLEKSAFSELGTGQIARGMSEFLGITLFFGHISKKAGIQGRTLLATDIANTNWYFLFEKASSAKVALEMIQRQAAPNITKALDLREYGYQYNNIMPGEYQLHTANDARHLVTARGLMQEALRTPEEKHILSIWAPKHAERIDDYIERQIKCEAESQVGVRDPAEFKDVSPKEESSKMAIYGKPPFSRTVREYVPILQPLAYEIDLMLNDFEQKISLDQVSDKIKVYLETEPRNKDENKIHRRIQGVQNKIGELKKKEKLEKKDYEELARAVNTDRYGWKLKRKRYIF